MKKMPIRTGWWILALIIMYASVPPASQAQRFITGPATALDDAKSVLYNPALVSFQRPKVAFGAKAHYLGVGDASGVPLRQGFFTSSTPFLLGDRIGVGGSVQYFDSPIYKRGALGLNVAGRILRSVSVGVGVSALNLSYNRDEFVGVEPGDPVFEGGTNKTTFSVSAGIFAKPIPNLNVALGVRNLNQPNLALVGDGFQAHQEFYGGVSYSFGALRARVEVADGQYGLDGLVALEAYSTDGSYVRVGSDSGFNTGLVEAQLHVGGPLSINYRYGLPVTDLRTSTSGSHLFTVVYEFGRSPEVPELPPPPPLLMEADRAEVEPAFEPKLYLASEQDYLQHFEKRVEREISVPREVLQGISREALGVLDSSFASTRGQAKGVPLGRIPENIKLADLLSSAYDSSLSEIQNRLQRDSTRVLKLSGRGAERVKAMGLYNRLRSASGVRPGQVSVETPDSTQSRELVGQQEVPAQETLSILTPRRAQFYLLDPYLSETGGAWTLIVENESGGTMKTFQGLGTPPSQLTWDWTSDEGDPLDQGVYTYYFAWQDSEGRRYESNRRTLYVRKVVRKVTIKVTQDPSALENPADALQLRIEE